MPLVIPGFVQIFARPGTHSIAFVTLIMRVFLSKEDVWAPLRAWFITKASIFSTLQYRLSLPLRIPASVCF